MEVDLKGIPETLLLPLYARALYHPYYPDPKAVEVFNSIEYDFEGLREKTGDSILFCLGRSISFDNAVGIFLMNNPDSIIVDLGCGLDTIGYRVNGKYSMWVNVDLPNVMDIRKNIFVQENSFNLSDSVFDDDSNIWALDSTGKRKYLFLAGGLFLYYEEEKVKKLMTRLSEYFPDSELVFDCSPTWVVGVLNDHMKQNGLEGAEFKFGLDDPYELESWHPNIKVSSWAPHFHHLMLIDSIPVNEKMKAKKYSELNKSKIIRVKFNQ